MENKKPQLSSYIEFSEGSGRVVYVGDTIEGDFLIKVIDDDGILYRVKGSKWNEFLAKQEEGG